jgi:HPt (histidine-containing phosphotransfer) domain-containing protein
LKLTAPENLKDRYQDSVNQLAKVDPVLAYQLSGRPRTDLNEIIDTFVARASQLEAQRAQSGSNPDAVTWVSSFVKTHGMKKMLSSMEADIIDVAGAIGYFTKRRTRRRVNELTIRLSEDVEEMVDQFLDSLAEFASQNAMPPASGETPRLGIIREYPGEAPSPPII